MAIGGYYNIPSEEREKLAGQPFGKRIKKFFSFSDIESEGKKKKEIKFVIPEDWIEKTHLRKLTSVDAKELAFDLFDVYKKVHGMPSYT
jgi:hypothetical protein